MSATYEPARGDLVTVNANGDIGEVEAVHAGGIEVRIVQVESAWFRQVITFNAGQVTPLPKKSEA